MYIIPWPLCLRWNQSIHLPSILETTRLITSRERRPVHRTPADLCSTFPRSISEPSSSHRHRHRPHPHLTSLPPPLCLRLPLGTTSLITRTNPTASHIRKDEKSRGVTCPDS